MIEKLKTFQTKRTRYSNIHELAQSLIADENLKRELEELSRVFLHKTVSGCKNCYHDAYIQLMNLKIEDALKKMDVES